MCNKKLSEKELNEYIMENIFESDDDYDCCDICKKQQNVYCKNVK